MTNSDFHRSAATGYGPCVICGDMNYSLSCGGPTICPKCDCGNFDAATVMKQAKVIASLREQLSAPAQSVRVWGPTQEDMVAKAVMLDDGCGLTINGQRVLCDDPRIAEPYARCFCRKAAKAALSVAAQPPAATVESVGMTYNTISAAFDEYRKTLTVMDKRPSFDSFSQGYVAGWNAKEAQPHNDSSAATGDDIELLRADIRDSRAINDALRDEIDRLRAVPQTVLWCCHARGPDDVYAAPDYATALAWSDMLNAVNWSKNSKLEIKDPASWDECLIKAAPAPWPHSPEAHAENMPKSIEGFSSPLPRPEHS